MGERADALALDPDYAEPRAGEAGIDAEHDHGVIVRGRADGQRRALPLVPSKPMPELQARVVAFVERHPKYFPDAISCRR